MSEWQDYPAARDRAGHTIVGRLKVRHEVWSPQLDNRRDVLVYLPPFYEQADKRYPVIYMHDGQNLFDEATSFAGEWQVDETLETLGREEGLQAIVVGIPNREGRRWDEYSPFRDRRLGGGQGDAYLAFVVETLKPLIDRDFRTSRERAQTGIMGSSMGGLISLYAFFRHPDVFGFAGVMSPAFWFAGGAIWAYVDKAPLVPGKVYLDVGTEEISQRQEAHLSLYIPPERYHADARRMRDVLVQKGYRPGQDLLYVEQEGAIHHESAWARRLPGALRFLLSA